MPREANCNCSTNSERNVAQRRLQRQTPFEPFFEGLVDGGAVPVGSAGVLGQGEPQVAFVEVRGPGGLGGELYHLVPASLVGLAALGVLAAEDAGLLVAEGAGADG